MVDASVDQSVDDRAGKEVATAGRARMQPNKCCPWGDARDTDAVDRRRDRTADVGAMAEVILHSALSRAVDRVRLPLLGQRGRRVRQDKRARLGKGKIRRN